jgi:hypothetical protein
MIDDNFQHKKRLRICLDIVFVLFICSVLNSIFNFIDVNISYFRFIGVSQALAILFFLIIFKFEWRLRKWTWVILTSLIFVGLIIQMMGYASLLSNLSNESLSAIAQGGSLISEHPVSIIYYLGIIVYYFGIISLLTFYFVYYRKYLNNKLTLQEIGGAKFSSEQEIKTNYMISEKRYTKIVSWLVWIVLAFVVLGIIYSFLTN